ncbi:cell cycle protein, FtsW/RodA/SpoVE family [Oribacterium sp. oral taxon 078 str. F0262]|uniref:FtsW/RodA/SpoVE family cell cycle protein n=1 Tax=Oribacterium sp. oral taxon 078 TaxID=652706 RepID=UPI0001BCB997|nr:cell cycle protein, FtsW/RodA/SpoVE family [Oribacterium sp. oral taxon 078 str. F0262]
MGLTRTKKIVSFYDYSLLFAVLFILGFGLLILYSASSGRGDMEESAMSYLRKQGFFAVGGLVLMFGLSHLLDYRFLRVLALPGFAAACGLVLLTAAYGAASHGSTRWFTIFGVRFQPSELVKFTLIIMEAREFSRLGSQVNSKKSLRQPLLLAFFPAIFIAFSNLSTGIIILGIFSLMLFVARKEYKPFFYLFLLLLLLYLAAYPFAVLMEKCHIMHGYQLMRIYAWKRPLDPRYVSKTYQTVQGLYAIGSGGIFGRGLGESLQKFMMPEAQNDMIFTILCEELGLFGAVSLILIYLFILYRLYDIARNAPDLFGSFLVIGVMSHIGLQAVLNIAVACNQIPNTGVTLPFVSYGGTALVLLLLEIGICLSVSKQTKLELR